MESILVFAFRFDEYWDAPSDSQTYKEKFFMEMSHELADGPANKVAFSFQYHFDGLGLRAKLHWVCYSEAPFSHAHKILQALDNAWWK